VGRKGRTPEQEGTLLSLMPFKLADEQVTAALVHCPASKVFQDANIAQGGACGLV